MNTPSARLLYYLFLDFLLISICIWHLPSIFHRAKSPFIAKQYRDNMIVHEITDSTASGILAPGDILLSWDNSKFEFFETLEFYSNFAEINSPVQITFNRDNTTYITQIRLIPYYASIRYILIIVFVGIVIFGVGIFILLNGPPGPSTWSLHWALVSLGVSVLLTTGKLDRNIFSTYLFETIFYTFYMMTVSQFFYFSTLFPTPKPGTQRFKKNTIFIPSFVFIAVLCFFRSRAIYSLSLNDLNIFHKLFDAFHLALFFYVGGSLFNFIHSFRQTKVYDEKQRLKWILWGITIGATPFLFLSIGPQLFDQPELIQEEFTLVFFLVIPFSFAIAIVRYKLLNIDILINRTILYFMLTLLIGVIYIFAVLVATSAIGGEAVFDEYLFIIVMAFLIAISFNSIRSRLQKLIDESFFGARENYRRSFEDMSTHFHQCLSPNDLFESIMHKVQEYIPITNVHIYRFQDGSLILSAGDSAGTEIQLSTEKASELAAQKHLFALPGIIREENELIDFSHTDFLRKTGFSMFVPLSSDENELLAILLCDPLQTKTPLINDEADLLLNGCREASAVLERLLLQEKIILEREEKQRLQQLNKLKSFFVSSVTHDLKTPLTSIKMFAEILKSKKQIPENERNEFFSIIEGESERLTQLINNVLDFSKIEQRKKEYSFSQININHVVDRAMLSMKYQLKLNNFKTKVEFRQDPIIVNADEDALVQALINLISNAIKYSADQKNIHITTGIADDSVVLSIADKGIGISPKDKKKIFRDFYRASEIKLRERSGAGLGLSIVKNIVDAHSARISVTSTPGMGSKFIIHFPMEHI